MAAENKRTIKLFCPSLSKLVSVVAWEEQRLDLGSIARAFGIELATLKLNGHFISRGIDLIASSVTWKSLLSFFSARGFSTGASESDALIVDGKLSKLGTKRGAQSPVESEIQSVKGFIDNAITHQESTKRIKDDTPGTYNCINQTCQFNSLCLKRKLGLEGSHPVKRNRTDKSNSDLFTPTRDRQVPCSCEVKRMREEDMAVASSPLKRIRN